MSDKGVVATDASSLLESTVSDVLRTWDEDDDVTVSPDVASSEDATGAESGAEIGTTDTQEVPADRGDGRDAKGRFAPKGATEDGQQDPAGEAAAKAPAPDPDAASATPATSADAKADAGDTAAEQVPEPSTYSVRFGQTDYEIPGAVRTATHIVIPIEQESIVSRYIGGGLKLEQVRGNLNRERAALSVDREMFQAETGPVMEEVKRLFDIAQIADDEQFAEAMLRYGLELRQQLPLLRERMELSKRKQELEVERRQMAPDPEQAVEQLAQNTVETAAAYLRQWKRDAPEAKPLTDEDWDWAWQRVQRDPAAYLGRAGQRLTPEQQANGLQPGEVYVDLDKLADTVRLRIEHRTALVEAAKSAQAAIAAAKQNAKRQAVETVPPPPVNGADVSAASARAESKNTYSSLDELKRDLGVAF